MQWGLVGANAGAYADAPHAITLAKAAEAAGFDSLWTFEHVIAPLEYDSTYPYSPKGKAPGLLNASLPDPLVWLAYVAGHTTSIRLGTGILILPQRNPVVLAKEVATLDNLSGGRVRLGIGVGWLEEEFDAIGVPFDRRGARTDDAIRAMRALWGSDDASHDGEFFRFEHVRSLPRPAGGDVHITVGGHSEAAAKRAGRLADGFIPALDSATIAEHGLQGAVDRFLGLVALARRTAEEHGRDPDALEVSLNTGMAPPPEVVEHLEANGVDRIVVFIPTRDPAEVTDAVAALAKQVGLQG